MKYYFTVHSLAETECRTKMGFIIRHHLFQKKIRPITISKRCEESFRKFYGYHSYQEIDNGCRAVAVTPKFNRVEQEISQFKLTASTKVFINVARPSVEKNQELLITSFQRFVESGIDAILLIIADEERYESRANHLRSLIKTDKIHFLGARTNVYDYLSLSDYFCLTSTWEGMPISLLEAGSAGCYPVVTPAGGCVDIIKDEKWGVLAADFSESSYLSALNIALEKHFERREIQNLYTNDYSMKKCTENYIKVFSDK